MKNRLKTVIASLLLLYCFSLNAQGINEIEVCIGSKITLTATAINAGDNPTFQWMKNNVQIEGATNSKYSYIPEHGDTIVCMVTSNADCVSPQTVMSINVVINVVDEKCRATLIGTVFPYVYYEGADSFNKQFSIAVTLKPVPTDITSETAFEDLLAETPVYPPVNAIYYDGTIFVPGTPKSPGSLGQFNNFGLPVNFPDAVGKPHGISNSTLLEKEEQPDIVEGATVGLFVIESVAPGNYILEIKRDGYMVRWAKIDVKSETPIQYLGHRELIPGDIGSLLKIDAQGATELLLKKGYYFGHKDYLPEYDLNADGFIDSYDYYLLQKYINFRFYHYEETEEWIISE